MHFKQAIKKLQEPIGAHSGSRTVALLILLPKKEFSQGSRIQSLFGEKSGGPWRPTGLLRDPP
jgi:hypothetical protein